MYVCYMYCMYVCIQYVCLLHVLYVCVYTMFVTCIACIQFVGLLHVQYVCVSCSMRDKGTKKYTFACTCGWEKEGGGEVGSTTHWKREVYLTRLPCYCSTVESYLMKGTIDPPHTRRVSLSLSLSLSLPLSFFLSSSSSSVCSLQKVWKLWRRFCGEICCPNFSFLCQKCFFNFFTKRGVTFFLAF